MQPEKPHLCECGGVQALQRVDYFRLLRQRRAVEGHATQAEQPALPRAAADQAVGRLDELYAVCLGARQYDVVGHVLGVQVHHQIQHQVCERVRVRVGHGGRSRERGGDAAARGVTEGGGEPYAPWSCFQGKYTATSALATARALIISCSPCLAARSPTKRPMLRTGGGGISSRIAAMCTGGGTEADAADAASFKADAGSAGSTGGGLATDAAVGACAGAVCAAAPFLALPFLGGAPRFTSMREPPWASGGTGGGGGEGA
jgi:hypothetical protein